MQKYEKDADLEDGLENHNSAVVVTDNSPKLNHVESSENLLEDDPWALTEEVDTGPAWSELSNSQRLLRVLSVITRIVFVLGCLYFFICSLDLLSSAFRLLGGRAAGEVLRQNKLLANPVCGLMVGVMVTVLVQSSSTSTSIVVAMVSSDLLVVRTAIPIVMGANIGTSVTNTIVAMTMAGDRNQFRRAFGGATVHDMFNWISVFIFLPLEVITGYLYRLTNLIMDSMNLNVKGQKVEFLKVITSPFSKLIVQLDSKVIEKISIGGDTDGASMLKYWCKSIDVKEGRNLTFPGEVNMTAVNMTVGGNDFITESYGNGTIVLWNATVKHGIEKCKYLFMDSGLSELAVGGILLVMSLIILCLCLMGMVKILQSLLKGHVANIIRKTINSDFPGPLRHLTGYVAILVGAGMTILVQSSSVFTSTLTPLVGAGIVTIDRVYPLTLGSNIGTTATSILAALASSSSSIRNTLQIAFCHLFFNISGILALYPIPFMRKIPINLAKNLGDITAKYRWFAILYLIGMFLIIPMIVFGLSIPGWQVLLGVGGPILLFFIVIIVINISQKKCPGCLPNRLKSWSWLPLCCRSLKPIDDVIQSTCGRCTCRSCSQSPETPGEDMRKNGQTVLPPDEPPLKQTTPAPSMHEMMQPSSGCFDNKAFRDNADKVRH